MENTHNFKTKSDEEAKGENTNGTNNSSENEQKENLKIFLSCLPKSLNEGEIKTAFSKFGEIADFKFDITQQNNGKSQLINAILTCSTAEMKAQILNQTHTVKDHVLKVTQYLDEEELEKMLSSLKRRKIYLKKLKNDFNNGSLFELFSQFGAVEKAYCTEGTRKRKGFKYGYVIFKEAATMKKLPRDGIPHGSEIIEWTSHERKQLKRRQEGKAENPSLREGNSENDCLDHKLKPTAASYYAEKRTNPKDDFENLLLTVNTKKGYFRFLRELASRQRMPLIRFNDVSLYGGNGDNEGS